MIKVELHLPESIITEEPMPRPRSYHDSRPKITVEYSASTLSRWCFFPAILRYLQRLELPRRLQGVTIPSAPTPVNMRRSSNVTSLVTEDSILRPRRLCWSCPPFSTPLSKAPRPLS